MKFKLLGLFAALVIAGAGFVGLAQSGNATNFSTVPCGSVFLVSFAPEVNEVVAFNDAAIVQLKILLLQPGVPAAQRAGWEAEIRSRELDRARLLLQLSRPSASPNQGWYQIAFQASGGYQESVGFGTDRDSKVRRWFGCNVG